MDQGRTVAMCLLREWVEQMGSVGLMDDGACLFGIPFAI